MNFISSTEQFPLIVKTKKYEFIFSAMGKLYSFLNEQKKEVLDQANPGKGFYLILNSLYTILLSEIEYKNDILRVSSKNKTQSVWFLVIPREEYCYFKIIKFEGIPITNHLSLHFEMNITGLVKAFDTDYMTFVKNKTPKIDEEFEHAIINGLITKSPTDGDVHVIFNYIWNRNPENPLGSFALYAPLNDDDEDDIILKIWANENMPHPNVDKVWTYDYAKKWVAKWQELFVSRNQFMLEGESLEDLYKGAEYAKKTECNEVYLFTNSWRNTGFWPENELNWSLRKDMYPDGEEDLRKFADFLWEDGIRLNLHYVSGGLGFGDPQYVLKPDNRLASFGDFDLVYDITNYDIDIYVRPKKGVELPYLCCSSVTNNKMPAMYEFFGYKHFRIGNEIIKVGSFEETDKDVWKLQKCIRGVNTVIGPHIKGEITKGLIDTYGINFIPDNDSTLLKEIAENFAGFINRCHISHTEYDGAEIHNYNGNWAYQKFASIVYANLDHPVTAHDSGATQPKCYIEYRLNKTKRIMKGSCKYTHGNYSIPFVTNSNTREATNKLDAHYSMSQGYKGGALGFSKPEPMFGVSVKDLESHGETDTLIQILKTWREVAANLNEKQKTIIENSFYKPIVKYEQSHHIASENVFVAQKIDQELYLVPTTILKRKSGDVDWQHCQEHGPIGPKQFVKLGDSLFLNNSNKEQTPKFLIRLRSAYDYDMETRSVFEFKKMAGVAQKSVQFVVAGNSSEKSSNDSKINCNMLLNPKLEQFYEQSVTGVRIQDNLYIYEAENPYDKEYYEGYKLPTFDCRTNMTNHKGIGLSITGDGSGALFAILIAGRDYIIPIDFVGKKYIEILNGEVSWHDSNWGWRMATKSTRYEMVTYFKTGFCYIPPKTATSIIVEDMKLLKEIQSPIDKLKISNNVGNLIIFGEIHTGDYIEYNGGDSALIYDGNYKNKREEKIENNNFQVINGYNKFDFSTESTSNHAWLEIQMMTEGNKIKIR
jgi:hypothetical protein